MGNFPVSVLGVGPQVAHSGCPLLLRDGLNADNRFHYVVMSMIECDKKKKLMFDFPGSKSYGLLYANLITPWR